MGTNRRAATVTMEFEAEYAKKPGRPSLDGYDVRARATGRDLTAQRIEVRLKERDETGRGGRTETPTEP